MIFDLHDNYINSLSISGAASGIGKAVSSLLLSRGARVVSVDASQSALDQLPSDGNDHCLIMNFASNLFVVRVLDFIDTFVVYVFVSTSPYRKKETFNCTKCSLVQRTC